MLCSANLHTWQQARRVKNESEWVRETTYVTNFRHSLKIPRVSTDKIDSNLTWLGEEISKRAVLLGREHTSAAVGRRRAPLIIPCRQRAKIFNISIVC